MVSRVLVAAIALSVSVFAANSWAASEDTPVVYTGGPAPGNVFGALDSDDGAMTQRPSSCSAQIAPTANGSYKYDTMTFTNNSSAPVTATYNTADASGVCGTAGNDPILIVYTGGGSFNPAQPLLNCEQYVASTGACTTVNFAVPVGATKTIVITSNSVFITPPIQPGKSARPEGTTGNGLFGYQNNFSSPTPVSLQSYSVDQDK